MAVIFLFGVIAARAQNADLEIIEVVATRPDDSGLRTFTYCELSIRNNGPAAVASEAARIDFYLSANAVFGDYDDVMIGDAGGTLSIAPGAEAHPKIKAAALGDICANWTEGLVPFGYYHLYAKVRILDGSPADPAPTNDYGRTAQVFRYGTEFNVLHTFGTVPNDGEQPHGTLINSGATLYGTTSDGGGGLLTGGTIFKVNTNGTDYAVIKSFTTFSTEGYEPTTALVLFGTNLYGMTSAGGVNDMGTIFRIDTNGSGHVVLHHFAGAPADGKRPVGGLTLSGTKLYGMTQMGGAGDMGTVFKIDLDGTNYEVLHHFGGLGIDGAYPASFGSLTPSGAVLYGMLEGGDGGRLEDQGPSVVFKINTNGTGYANVCQLPGSSGYLGSLALSGTTLYGMAYSGVGGPLGSLFCVQTDGSGYRTLHQFGVESGDGYEPAGSPLISGDIIFGMTHLGGGTNDGGMVFAVHADGSGYVNLHNFSGGVGDGPYGGTPLLIGSALFGTTSGDFDVLKGTVFSLSITNLDLGTPEACDGRDNDGDGQIDEGCRNSASCFSARQTIRCAGSGWSRTFVMDLTNFRNLAIQDGYQSYAVEYDLYYTIWTGVYLYDYASGAFSAVTWLINLDL